MSQEGLVAKNKIAKWKNDLILLFRDISLSFSLTTDTLNKEQLIDCKEIQIQLTSATGLQVQNCKYSKKMLVDPCLFHTGLPFNNL